MPKCTPAIIATCLALVFFFSLSAEGNGAQPTPGPAEGQTDASAQSAPPAPPGSPGEEAKPAPSDGAEPPDDFDFAEEPARVSPVRIADPLEPVNRVFFQVNDKLYFWVLKPAAQGYKFVLMEDLRLCVSNFFSNLLTPVRLLNCILQGKFNNAKTEVARFVVNSTVGIYGLGDPGKTVFNMDISDEDFGQTLGLWGFGHGFYIVWPVIGSSTLRESAGFLGDSFVNPIGYLDPSAAALGVGAYRRFNDLSFRIGEYEAVKAAALEPYSAVRDGYIQFRNALVAK